MSSTLPTSSSSPYAAGADAIEGPRDLAALHRDIWAVMRMNPMLFVVMPALAWFPADFFSEWVALQVAGDDVFQQVRITTRIAQVANIFIGSFVTATVLSALREVGQGVVPTFASSTRDFRSLFAPLVAVTFLAGIFIGLGTVALIIPGVVLFVRYSLVAPVVVFEGLRGMDALRRSKEIVESAGALRVFGYGLAGYLIYFMLSLFPSFAVGFVGGLVEMEESALLNAVTSIPFNILISGLLIGVALLYADDVRPADQYPLGHSLIDAQGVRRPSPTGTGVPGLIVATLCAALTLPMLAFVVGAAIAGEVDDAEFDADFDLQVDADVDGPDEGVVVEVEGDVVIGGEDVAPDVRDVD